MARAPGEAFKTLLDGSSTTPADSSTSSTWSMPSGMVGATTRAALDPRRSAMCSTITNAAPRKMPKASAVSTTHMESMASP